MVRKSNGEYEGFIPDLLDAISEETLQRYDLSETTDTYGSLEGGRWTGLMGKVVRKVSLFCGVILLYAFCVSIVNIVL